MKKYIEAVVPRKNNFSDFIKSVICTFLPMLLGTYLVVLCSQVMPGFTMLAIVICAVLVFLSYKIYCSFNVEWEYTIVDNELRFSKIINKSKRRDVITANISKADVIASVKDPDHKNEINSVNKKYYFISQTMDDYYFIISETDKMGKACIFFEPSDEMLENFRITARGKVFICNN